MRRARLVAVGVGAAVLALLGCATSDGEVNAKDREPVASTEASTTTASTATTVTIELTTTTTSPRTTTTRPPKPTTTTTAAVRKIAACDLLDTKGLKKAGFKLDNPKETDTRRTDRARAAEVPALDGMDGLFNCEAGWSVTLIVWDAVSPEAASASLDSTLSSSSENGRLPLTPVPATISDRGSTVIDAELDHSTVQWQSGDLHIAINLNDYSLIGLTPAEIQALLLQAAAHAQAQL